MDKYTQAYLNVLKSEVAAKAQTRTQQLRSLATDTFGWSPENAESLNVRPKGHEYRITHSRDSKNAVLTEEYGTEGVPFKPAVRTFVEHIRNGSI